MNLMVKSGKGGDDNLKKNYFVWLKGALATIQYLTQ
jgi:hypothetical protein